MCGRKKGCHHHTGNYSYHCECHGHYQSQQCCCGYSHGPAVKTNCHDIHTETVSHCDCHTGSRFNHHPEPGEIDRSREIENLKAYLNSLTEEISSLQTYLDKITEREEQNCEHPERLKGKEPGECSEEQKKECHGE